MPCGKAKRVSEQHAAAGDLRDSEVDEYDAASEHLRAKRHMRQRYENAGRKRRQQYR
jgi:hypothetical protein